jgi:hypothetical protein
MFRFFLLLLVNILFLSASGLPSSIESRVVSIKDNIIGLSGNIPSGRAGIVIHNYGKGLRAITHRAVSLRGNRALVKRYLGLEHDNIPDIKTSVRVGDKVLFGNLYSNILLIAPNKRVYKSITKKFPDRFWIHPDIYANFFIENGDDIVTIENLREFATKSLVGLVAIVAKDGLRILDPISGKYLRRLPLNINITEAQIPFYARFENIDDTFTKTDPNNVIKYFKMVEEIR